MRLTLSTDRTEPALGPPLPPPSLSGWSSNYRLSRSSTSLSGCFTVRGFRVGTIAVSALTFGHASGSIPGAFSSRSGSRFGIVMHNITASTKFNHIDGTFPAGDQVSTWEKDYFTRRREAEQTFARQPVVFYMGRLLGSGG